MAGTVPVALDARPDGSNVITFLGVVARLSLAALLASIAIALAAGLGTRFGWWNYDLGLFGIFPFAIYAGLAAFALGLLWILTALFAGGGSGALSAVIGFVGAIVVLWVPLDDLYRARIEQTLPPIHDISTDTEHAPAFIVPGDPGQSIPPPYEGLKHVNYHGRTTAMETLQKLAYGEIRPYAPLQSTPVKLLRRALTAARNMGWTVVDVAQDSQGGFIQATDTTLLFGLKDDIIVRVRPAGIGARLDIRSRSRVGESDFGRNAARITTYLKEVAAT
ncbi:MAG TPA: DUF1499 domain-containing protein [Rhizomicrobium sp.]|jgi:uncharacterized protein YaaQ|nr:DUF1499 domain-containing protein [Rhizomicrobium sp.]